MGNNQTICSSSTESTASTQTSLLTTSSERLTWDTSNTLVSMPQRGLLLDYDFIMFSAEHKYEKPQYVKINLRNMSAHEWILFRIQRFTGNGSHYSDNEDDMDIDPLSFMALPNIGIVAPGEAAQFKLILSTNDVWPCLRRNVFNKRTNIRIQQMRVNDPKAYLGSLKLDPNNEDLKNKLLELYGAISYSENKIEKIYSYVVPVFIPGSNEHIENRVAFAVEDIENEKLRSLC